MNAEQPASKSFLSALAAGRQQLAIGLGVVGVVLASAAIWWGIWGFARSESTSAATSDGKLLPDELNKPAEAKKSDDKPKKSPDYQIASIWAGAVALMSLLSAAWLFTQQLDPSGTEAVVRKEILFYGGTIGFITAMAGVFLGYRWHQSLVAWVGSDDATEAKWVLYAFAVFLTGLLIMFASLQLARSEQRTNAGLRRAMYGFNSVFVGLLLLLVLIAVNIVSFIKIPTTLSATDAAFTELADESKRFLTSLDRPVQVYLIMPEGHVEMLRGRFPYENLYTDCRGMLTQCEDESRHFKVSYLSPAFDRERIAALMDRLKIKEADRDQLGMLVAVGDNEEASTFIRADELIDVDRRGNLVFQGEHKLLVELMYLTDARAKEKIYFTQEHGELSIDGSGQPDRSATSMVQFLRDRKMTVEPLTFDGPEAKVPDDAAVVVIAGLRRTLAPDDPMIKALREFMIRPARPGKLLVCLPAFRNPQGRVGSTGLEGFLGDYGVEVDATHRLLSAPRQLSTPLDYVLAAPYRIDGDLARVFGRVPLILRDARPIRARRNAPTGMYQPVQVLGTDMITWQEQDYLKSADLLWNEFASDKGLRAEKQLTAQPVPVAVGVTESIQGEKPVQKPRLLVFGSETFLQDRGVDISGAEEFRQQLFSDSIDWLRERDASIGIPPRKVGIFAIEKPIEWSSQVVLLALVTIGITALGVGVWLSRRR